MRTTMLPRTLLALALACASLGLLRPRGTLEKIRSTGAITLGYIENAAPFSSVDGKGEPQGYSVDLCREIARGIGAQLGLPKLETRWIALTIQNRLEAVSSRRVDLECSTTTWTLARQRNVDFSLITFVDGGSILTKAGAGLGRLADLNGKRVAVIKGTTTEQAPARLAARCAERRGAHREHASRGSSWSSESKVEGFAADRTTLVGQFRQAGQRRRTGCSTRTSRSSTRSRLPSGEHDYRLAVNRVSHALPQRRDREGVRPLVSVAHAERAALGHLLRPGISE
jgi:hypothetical protein